MKTKEEKGRKIIKKSEQSFFKVNCITLILLILALFVIFLLSTIIIIPYINKLNLEKDISKIKITSLFSVDKITYYSNANAVNSNNNNKSIWNLDLKQYTDIAIYLKSDTRITNMYIDNIFFSNPSSGNLSLSYLSVENFGKLNMLEDISFQNTIKLNAFTPITLRYLNHLANLQTVTDIETPLSFNGSLLKRVKLPISSFKNTINFTLNIVDSLNNHYTADLNLEIPLQSEDKSSSIYDGYYVQTVENPNILFMQKEHY